MQAAGRMLDVAAEVSTLVRALSARPQPAAKLALLDTAAVDALLRGLRYPNAFLPVPSEASQPKLTLAYVTWSSPLTRCRVRRACSAPPSRPRPSTSSCCR